MSEQNLKLMANKLDELISYLENNDLESFFNKKNELCDMIMLENNENFNSDIEEDIKKIVPENLKDNFKNY